MSQKTLKYGNLSRGDQGTSQEKIRNQPVANKKVKGKWGVPANWRTSKVVQDKEALWGFAWYLIR